MLENITLENLPLEVLMRICTNLDLKDTAAVSETNTTLAKAARADSVWLNQFQIHFPHVLKKLKKQKIPVAEGTWYDKFVAAYDIEYNNGMKNNVKKAFSRAKENKENSFDDLHLTRLDLISVQANGLSLTDVARSKNNQAALDCFFQIEEAAVRVTRLPMAISTPVHYRQSDKIKALISQQTSPDIQALRELVFDGDVENFTLLSVHLQENHSQNDPNFIKNMIDSNDLLAYAIAGGHLKMVSCLLSMGANIEQPLNRPTYRFKSLPFKRYEKIWGYTPLSIAAHYGYLDIVECLLDANAKVDNPKGYNSPIFPAASRGHVEIVKLLMAKNHGLLEEKGLSERTPLMAAAKEGHADVVATLIHLGANTRAQSNDNRREAIHLAAMNGHLHVIENLLTHDKELINEKDTLGKTPLVYAHLYRKDQIVNYLRERLPPEPKEAATMIANLQALKDMKPLKEWYSNQLSHYKILSPDKLAWINQPAAIVTFASTLSLEEFKAFFYSVVRLNICSINAVTNALTTHPNEEKIFKDNQTFIKNFVLPFASYRKIIEDSIEEFERKAHEIKRIGDNWSKKRSRAILLFASILAQKSNNFFTNPSPESAQHFLDQCQKLLPRDYDPGDTFHMFKFSINHPQTSEISRIINTILLVIAHIFIITIPIIWLHPASRNLLLGKTESQAKLEDAVDKVRQFNQLMQQGKFNSVFHPPQPTARVTEATHTSLPLEKRFK